MSIALHPQLAASAFNALMAQYDADIGQGLTTVDQALNAFHAQYGDLVTYNATQVNGHDEVAFSGQIVGFDFAAGTCTIMSALAPIDGAEADRLFDGEEEWWQLYQHIASTGQTRVVRTHQQFIGDELAAGAQSYGL
ncbi:hypothetical protein JCM10213_001925 [Rhodosporidiobolus nylandii]